MRISEAIDRYEKYRGVITRNTNSEKFNLRQFAHYFHDCDVSDVDNDEVTEYVTSMLDLGWDTNSVRCKGLHLKKFFEYYQDYGEELLVNPRIIPVPERTQKMPRICTEENYKRLLSAIKENPKTPGDPRASRNRLFVRMLWDTGARNSEILSIKIEDLEECTAIIHTEKNKTQQNRRIFWSKETQKELKKWLSVREKCEPICDFVFVKGWGAGVNKGKQWTNKDTGKMMANVSRLAGLPTVNAHSFRHNFGRVCAKEGLNNSVISSLLGHSDIQSSKVYTNLFGEELREQWERVGERLTVK